MGDRLRRRRKRQSNLVQAMPTEAGGSSWAGSTGYSVGHLGVPPFTELPLDVARKKGSRGKAGGGAAAQKHPRPFRWL